MSFRCGICNELSKPNESAVSVVLDRRPRTYPSGEDATVTGWEIVSECLAHAPCAGKVESERQAQKIIVEEMVLDPEQDDLADYEDQGSWR